MVDREVAQIEETITHPGVFPVDDANRRPVVDEVRVQQIVVTGDQRLRSKRAFDVKGDRPRPLDRRRQLAAVSGGRHRVRFHYAKR